MGVANIPAVWYSSVRDNQVCWCDMDMSPWLPSFLAEIAL